MEFSIDTIERAPLFTAAEFWAAYGEKTGLNQEQFQIIWGFGEARYAKGPGHDFHHGCDVLWTGMEIADRLDASRPNEPPIKRKALTAALLLHDVGQDEDYRALGFQTAEDYAAAITAELVVSIGFMPDETQETATIIRSSGKDVEPETDAEVVMNLSDMFNVGKDYDEDLTPRTDEFREEAKMRQGDAYDERNFMLGSMRIIAQFITKNLHLGGIERLWQQRAINNFGRMVEDYARRYHESVSSVVQTLGTTAVQKLLGDRPESKDQAAVLSDSEPGPDSPSLGSVS